MDRNIQREAAEHRFREKEAEWRELVFLTETMPVGVIFSLLSLRREGLWRFL